MRATPLPDIARVDAYDKVRGATLYAADQLHSSALCHARAGTDRQGQAHRPGPRRCAMPGVVRILTERDFPPRRERRRGKEARLRHRHHCGARSAIAASRSRWCLANAGGGNRRRRDGRARYSGKGSRRRSTARGARREPAEEKKAGNGAAAFATAQTKIDQSYVSPTQHHNPIEMLATSATFENGRLTIYECTQRAGVRGAVAATLRLDPERIDVSPSVGGGFGQKTRAYGHSALVARAAILSGRPVKLVMPHSQIFHQATFRPESHHRVRLGADGTGKMIAAVYHAEHEQSQQGQFPFVVSRGDKPSLRHRELPRHGRQHSHRPAESGPYALPHPHPSCFAFESAVDELALKLGRDPVEFGSPMTGAPIRSPATFVALPRGASRKARDVPAGRAGLRSLGRCGWPMAPRSAGAWRPGLSLDDGSGDRHAARRCRRPFALAASGHEMGQGIRTSIANVTDRGLGLDPDGLELAIGDTSVAPQHLTAGSWGTAGASRPAARAVDRMRAALRELLAGRSISGNIHRQLATVRRPIWKYR